MIDTLREDQIIKYGETYYKVIHSDKFNRPNLITLPQHELINLIKEGRI
jgi:hypothetical protein